MPNEQMLSVTSLHTVSGASLAVFLIVQLLKNLPFLRTMPTKWLAVVIGELIVFAVSPHPLTTAEWIVLLVNGIQAASAAIGGYQIFTASQPSRGADSGMGDKQFAGKTGARHRKSSGV